MIASSEAVAKTEALEIGAFAGLLMSSTSSEAGGWTFRTSGRALREWTIRIAEDWRRIDSAENGIDEPEERLRVRADWERSIRYRPRTELGRRLWNIRARIVASGRPLLSWDELEREVVERRGEPEREHEEGHLR